MVAVANPAARLTAAQAAVRIGEKFGFQPHADSVKRWSRHGLKVGGERVRLPAVRLASRYLIAPDDLDAFLARVSGAGAVLAAG